MAFIVERARLYATQVNAKNMGLTGTAGRLKILRKQMDGYHKLSDAQREDRLKWGVAKLRETKGYVQSEATDLGMKPEVWDIQGDSAAANKFTKFVGIVGTMALMGDVIRKVFTEQCSHFHAFKVMAIAATAMVAVFRIVDMFFSSNLDESVQRIKRTIDRCSSSFSHEIEIFQRAPPMAKKEEK